MNKGGQKVLRKFKAGMRNVTLGFLDMLLSATEGAIRSTMNKSEAYRIAYGFFENEWSTERISKFFGDLKRSGYIQIEKKGQTESLIFTNKAKIALLERFAQKLSIENKYRYISFDIPESMKRQRDGFRRAIKRMGFRQVQKSLWVINKNVGTLVDLAVCEYGVGNYVAYIIGERSDIDRNIRTLLENNS